MKIYTSLKSFIVDSNPVILFISIVHLFVSIFFEPLVFINYEPNEIIKVITLRLVSFGIIYIGWWSIFYIYKKVKSKDVYWLKFAKIFLIYFSIMSCFYLILWPGIWVWDEFFIYDSVQYFDFLWWQHYLTSTFYMISLMIFPFAAGIVLVQYLIISLIVTFITVELSKYTRYYYFLLLIFLFPPIITFTFYPMRASLYGYILLFNIVYLVLYLNAKEKIYFRDLLPIFFTLPILFTWRSEGLIYIPFFIILLYIVLRKKCRFKIKVLIISVLLFESVVLAYPQQSWLNAHQKQKVVYSLTSMLNPLSMMLVHPDLKKYDEVEKDLKLIVDIDLLKKNASYYDMEALHSNPDKLIISQDVKKFDKFKKAYFKLVLNNIGIFYEVRLKTFNVQAGNEKSYIGQIAWVSTVLEKRTNEHRISFEKRNGFNKTLSIDTRNYFIYLLQGRNPSHEENATLIHTIFWNLYIVLALLVGIFLYTFLKRNWLFLVVVLMLFANVVAVFITSPATLFMYYFPIYLTTFVISFCFIFALNKNAKEYK